jgi:hypothetical protein
MPLGGDPRWRSAARLILDLLNRTELAFFSGVLSAGGSQRALEFFRLYRLSRYPGAAGEL